jgi:hypothetical protein
MLSVVYAEFINWALNAECHYAECRYAECHGAKHLERTENILNIKEGLKLFLYFLLFCCQPWTDGIKLFTTGVDPIKRFWRKFTNVLCKLHLFIGMQQMVSVFIKWSGFQKSLCKFTPKKFYETYPWAIPWHHHYQSILLNNITMVIPSSCVIKHFFNFLLID